MSETSCPFCDLPQERIVHQNEMMLVVRDHHPVNKGHTLVIPKRHVKSVFELDGTEWSALNDALTAAKAGLDQELSPDGYNIGTNVGETAGQNQEHAYLHLIPRYKGDHPEPQGGVRHVIPWKR